MNDPTELHARIVGTPGHEAIYIGGHLIPCTAAKIDMSVEHLPVLTLTLPVVHGLDVDLRGAQVVLDETSRDALVELGWTPPAQDAAE